MINVFDSHFSRFYQYCKVLFTGEECSMCKRLSWPLARNVLFFNVQFCIGSLFVFSLVLYILFSVEMCCLSLLDHFQFEVIRMKFGNAHTVASLRRKFDKSPTLIFAH